MRCGKVEKYLYSFSGDPADQKNDPRVQEHLHTCINCREIELSLKKMEEICLDTPDYDKISESEIEEIVSDSFGYNQISSGKIKSLKEYFWIPKIAVVSFSAVLIAVAVFLIKPVLEKELLKSNYRNTAAFVKKDQEIQSVSGDSVLCFGQNCTMLLKKNSRCTIVKAEEKVVIVELDQGKVFVAAAKGMYDTIAICCNTFRVYATGTHFEVDHGDKQIKVSVLEGKVKTVQSTGNETGVGALENLIFQTENGSTVKGQINSDEQETLISNFALTAAANTRLGLKRAVLEKHGENTRRNQSSVNLKSLDQKSESRSDSSASRQLAIAASMMKKGRFESAVPVYECYLKIYNHNTDSAWFNLGTCYSYIRRYKEAVDAYKRVINESVDEQLAETALHRRDKILFLKLKLNDEARCGGQTYLKTYPHGKWREEEFYYLCRIALADNEIKMADSLTDQFVKEFPRNCHAYELLEEVQAKSK